ncbi:caspase family protein [Crocosphaera sp.]|uniref:caspase family protein n=1 Tax=Crocosphaera sp. TaxID=2729996 RepID=UPI0026068A62|nr:caspase family protein [Crocosphaera sp.]MDJ0580471.1 caspase family protein [Crocosphaera sp.]
MFPVRQFYRTFILTGLGFITVTASQATTHHNFIPVLFPDSTKPTHNQTLIAQKQSKVALVIGNSAYEEKPLSNPVNDARDMAKALQELGFEVTLVKDTDLPTMEEEIDKFSQQLRYGGVGLFYYAGHGIQMEGKNYLTPLKAELKREKDVKRKYLDLETLLDAMEAAQTSINILIIDACRREPFYSQLPSAYRSSSNRGLAEVKSLPEGTIIAFATAPDQLAEDGIHTRNSPFTSALLQHIKTANLDVQLMLRRVSESVQKKTNKEQKPWTNANLVGGEFHLNPQPKISPVPIPSFPPPPVQTPINQNKPLDSDDVPNKYPQPRRPPTIESIPGSITCPGYEEKC